MLDDFKRKPGPRGDAEEMYSLVNEVDEGFKHHLDRYKYAERFDGANKIEHRSACESYLQFLEKRLVAAPHLFGARACLADYAIVPFIRQFANTDQTWFCASPYSKVQAWLADLLDSSLFRTNMRNYPQWHEGDLPILTPTHNT